MNKIILICTNERKKENKKLHLNEHTIKEEKGPEGSYIYMTKGEVVTLIRRESLLKEHHLLTRHSLEADYKQTSVGVTTGVLFKIHSIRASPQTICSSEHCLLVE